MEPIITVEGVKRRTYEYHCQACDRTFAIHQSLEARLCTDQVSTLSGEQRSEQVLSSFVAVT